MVYFGGKYKEGVFMKKRYVFIILLLIVALIAAVIAGMKVSRFYKEYKNNITVQGEDINVNIIEGSGVKQIAKVLKENGLIEFEYSFVLKAKDSEYGNQLKYGDFTLNTGMCINDMLKILAKGGEESASIKVTIPEGYSIEMIANRLEKLSVCTAEEFLAAVQEENYDYEFLADIPEDANVKYRLQGYLFPATYQFTEGTPAGDVVNEMLRAFDGYFTSEDYAAAEVLDYSIFQVVTMASIVEREAKLAEERATIAGVINNRLDIDMKLQMCPTVLYPLTDGLYNVNQVLYKDLEMESPYNTYKNKGLPVGPISNPGKQSIEAVLHPEEHEYLFYHVDDEKIGNHIFTKTYQEHEDTRIKK